MNEKVFKISVAIVAVLFILIFCYLVIPGLIQDPDIMGAFAQGFVNPFSSAYSADAILCWVILLIWVVYELPQVKHGWICLLLGVVPGVAVGLALYLILRANQLKSKQ